MSNVMKSLCALAALIVAAGPGGALRQAQAGNPLCTLPGGPTDPCAVNQLTDCNGADSDFCYVRQWQNGQALMCDCFNPGIVGCGAIDAVGPNLICVSQCPDGTTPCLIAFDGIINPPGQPFISKTAVPSGVVVTCECPPPPDPYCPLPPAPNDQCVDLRESDCEGGSTEICVPKKYVAGQDVTECTCYDPGPPIECGPMIIDPNTGMELSDRITCLDTCQDGSAGCGVELDGVQTHQSSIDVDQLPPGTVVTCGCPPPPVPGVSEWGLAVTAMLTLAAAVIVIRRRGEPMTTA